MESDNQRLLELQNIALEAVDTFVLFNVSVEVHELMHTAMRDLVQDGVLTTPTEVKEAARDIGRQVEKVIQQNECDNSLPVNVCHEAAVETIRAEVLRRMPSGKMPHDDFFENVSAGQEPPLTQRSNLFPAQRSGPLGGKALL